MFALSMTTPRIPCTVFYIAPRDAFHGWVTDPHRAAQFTDRRSAFAHAMALEAGSLLPKGAEVEVIRAPWAEG